MNKRWHLASTLPTSFETLLCDWKMGGIYKHTPRFKFVRKLRCYYASPRTLGFASKLPLLRTLDIKHTDCVVKWQVLKKLTNLVSLDLSWSTVGSFGFLTQMTNLLTLRLVATQFENIQLLKNCNKLSTLDLNSTAVKEIRQLSEYCPNLSNLNIRACQYLGTSGLNFKHTKIECLTLSNNSTNNFTLHRLPTKLRSLNLNGCLSLTATGFNTLRKYPLRVLNLAHTAVDDLSVLSGLRELGYLNVSYTRITDLALQGLVNLPSLTKLNLRWCLNLTSAATKWIYKSPNIRVVYVKATRLDIYLSSSLFRL